MEEEDWLSGHPGASIISYNQSHFRGHVDGERHGRKIEFAAYDYDNGGRVVF